MSGAVSWWVEAGVAVLLAVSALFTLLGALGIVRLPEYFQRMHPPALAYTLGTWCATFASILYFSALERQPVLHAWIIIILLSITAPVTTTLLARAALFRRRHQAQRPSVSPPLRLKE